jgi:hypothetical protein
MLGFRNLVAHQWTGSYLLKQYGHHYRKALRLLSKLPTSAKYKSACRYVKYKKPPTAPPCDPLKYGTPMRVTTGAIGANGKG